MQSRRLLFWANCTSGWWGRCSSRGLSSPKALIVGSVTRLLRFFKAVGQILSYKSSSNIWYFSVLFEKHSYMCLFLVNILGYFYSYTCSHWSLGPTFEACHSSCWAANRLNIALHTQQTAYILHTLCIQLGLLWSYMFPYLIHLKSSIASTMFGQPSKAFKNTFVCSHHSLFQQKQPITQYTTFLSYSWDVGW